MKTIIYEKTIVSDVIHNIIQSQFLSYRTFDRNDVLTDPVYRPMQDITDDSIHKITKEICSHLSDLDYGLVSEDANIYATKIDRRNNTLIVLDCDTLSGYCGRLFVELSRVAADHILIDVWYGDRKLSVKVNIIAGIQPVLSAIEIRRWSKVFKKI